VAVYRREAPIIFERTRQLDRMCLPYQMLTRDDNIVIDLSRVSFIKPPALIGILVLLEGVSKMFTSGAPNISIFPPKDKSVLDYLLKVEFVEALRSLYDWEIPEKDLMTLGKRILPVIPITRFNNANDVEDIANRMQSTFRTKLVGLASLLQPCHVVFSELADNVLHHAESNGGFVLAQQYNYVRGPMLEIAVGDCGIGILASLSKKPAIAKQVKTEQGAIQLAMQDGITCFDNPYRGYGLGHVEWEVKHIAKRSLTVRSGTGYIIIRGGRHMFSDSCSLLRGTIVHTVMPCG